jgi:anti-sigma factor RsiW
MSTTDDAVQNIINILLASVKAAEARIAALEADKARLREALKPFGEASPRLQSPMGDIDAVVTVYDDKDGDEVVIRLHHFRAAAAALEATP